ncbi:MAG TPA: MotA/TolQ/ExbB proton channel family protein [Polyangiaceae bacterium]|jgi:biopolymer transport protein ExbB/biopolymer transport protein TolQ|nr:MotA/TolQ/ExbB proton channel family protein [Polyangiaceae bacterium]
MLIERLLKIALLGSEWVLYLLLILSVISLTTMVERWFYFRKHKDDLTVVREQLSAKLGAGDVAGAYEILKQGRSFEVKLARVALDWAHAGADAIADAVESELALVRKELERGSNFLGTAGNNAPFVGLLGTVLGVIIAFQALGKNGQNAGAMGDVMAGIAEALVATGVGLFVALPAVVAYNVIQRRVEEIEADATSLTKLIAAYSRSDAAIFDKPTADSNARRANADSKHAAGQAPELNVKLVTTT